MPTQMTLKQPMQRWAMLLMTVALTALGQAEGIPHASISVAATAAVQAALGGGAASTDLEPQPLDPRLRLSECEVPLDARLTGPLPGNASRAVVRVQCRGVRPWKVYVSVAIQRRADVAVAARVLEAGTVVTAADLRTETRVLAQLPGDALIAIDAIVGREIRHRIPAGSAIRRHQVRVPELVRRGQFVTIESSSGSIIVKMGGIVQSPGAAGSIVRVRNQTSGRLIQARVVDAGRVAALGGAH